MARYSVFGNGQTSNNTLLSHGLIASNASPRRFRVIEATLGSTAAPNDGTFSVFLLRTTTAAGTSSAVTPSPVDPADVACLTAAGTTFTVNPTLGVNLLQFGFNQRSALRWFAAPGEELVCAAVQFNGIGVQPAAPSPTASNIGATLVFDE